MRTAQSVSPKPLPATPSATVTVSLTEPEQISGPANTPLLVRGFTR